MVYQLTLFLLPAVLTVVLTGRIRQTRADRARRQARREVARGRPALFHN